MMTEPLHRVHCGRLWTPEGFRSDSVLHLAGGSLVSSADAESEGANLDASDAFVVPGLVDLQVNGALGWSFQAQHREHFDKIVAFHRQQGTTTFLPTLVTAPDETLRESLQTLAAYLDRAPHASLPGIHLEGPFLAPDKSGAHDPGALRLPDVDRALGYVAAAAERLAIVTLAPELPGAKALIEALASRGILVSAGHSGAGYTDMEEALAAGLACVTHAGNATDWPHREPGPLGFMASEPGVVGALLAWPDLACSVILDGYHFHPALLAPLVRLKGTDRVLLVSDASTVAGCPPGDYESGGLLVTVHEDGYATSGRGGGWLAGSIISLLEAVRRAVNLARVPLHEAIWMASLGPARLLGIDDTKGTLTPGSDADILVLNQDLSLRHVVVGGEIVR